MFGKKKRSGKNEQKVVLNQPITSEKEDWIGVKVYVDKLEAAIKQGAKMIAITSGFGSGKSSIVSLYAKRISWINNFFHCPKIHRINMWNCVEKNKDVRELHKTFVFNLVSKVRPSKSSYISRRLSKSYGLLKMHSPGGAYTFLVYAAIILLLVEEMLRRFGDKLSKNIELIEKHGEKIQLIAGVIFLFTVVYLICKADILFSSPKSEGKREIDENILIDYFNTYVMRKGFFRHYVIVIEDLDRTDDKELIFGFLKELEKYYLQSISGFRFNKVTFIINLKPEALLNEGSSCDRLFPKFFDYIIELRKINIDNYDVLLNGLLNDVKTELVKLDLLDKDSIYVNADSIKGMHWLIRGKTLDIRVIKDRLNSSLVLYESLSDKFKGKGIEFEKCAVAVYLVSEFENDFYEIGDRDFAELVEKNICGSLNNNYDSWGEQWEEVTSDFKNELYMLISDKLIDTSYRTYFYNYPKDSNLFDVSQNIVYNAIVYNEIPDISVDFEKHLDKVDESIIKQGIDKILNLGLHLPYIVLRYRKLFCYVAQYSMDECIWSISNLSYEKEDVKQSISIIKRILEFDKQGTVITEVFIDKLVVSLNGMLDGNATVLLREVICEVVPARIMEFSILFHGYNPFITEREIELLSGNSYIVKLLNYDSMPVEVDTCKKINYTILKLNPNEETDLFYEKITEKYGISTVYPLIKAYCQNAGLIRENINDILMKQILLKQLVAKEYIDIVLECVELNECVAESICKIKWYKGLPERVCVDLRNKGYILEYVCNYAHKFVDCINFNDDDIIDVIIKNATSIYETENIVFSIVRKKVSSDVSWINIYKELYTGDYPVLSEEEIYIINDIYTVIDLLGLNELTNKNIDYVIKYFNCEYRNGKITNAILRYVLGLSDIEMQRQIFLALDMDNVRYRKMSAQNKKDIFEKLKIIFDFDDIKEILLFLKHTKECNIELEKDIMEKIGNDSDLEEEYFEIINSLDKVTTQTIRNISQFNTCYIHSDVVNKELFAKKYYKRYVVSKTLGQKGFVVEQDKKNVLWDTYVDIFIKNNYKKTISYMKQNRDFIQEMIDRREYEKKDSEISNFSIGLQSEDLVNFLFENMSIEQLKEYFTVVEGFNSYEAAECFVKNISLKNDMLQDDNIYTNTYEKLVDPYLKSKYTKARNKEVRR